jgi:putative transposase
MLNWTLSSPARKHLETSLRQQVASRRVRTPPDPRTRAPRPALTGPHQEWALDFVHDAAVSGHSFRALSVLDVYTRECLALEVDSSLGSRRVTRVLDHLVEERGRPLALRCDNGPEFTSRQFLAWCIERGIEVIHIEPGKPVQNAHVESFHGRLREECLNASWFQNLLDARRKIAAWRTAYNEQRPHSSLGYQTPGAFARQVGALRPALSAVEGSPTAPCAPPLGPVQEAASQGSPPLQGDV